MLRTKGPGREHTSWQRRAEFSWRPLLHRMVRKEVLCRRSVGRRRRRSRKRQQGKRRGRGRQRQKSRRTRRTRRSQTAVTTNQMKKVLHPVQSLKTLSIVSTSHTKLSKKRCKSWPPSVESPLRLYTNTSARA